MNWKASGAIVSLVALGACGGGGGSVVLGPRPTPMVTLSVAVVGEGSVSSQPTGINCGRLCEMNVATGGRVQLTAKSAAGYVFGRWSGGCSGATTSCTVTLDAAKTVTAVFVPNGTASGWTSDSALSSAGAGQPIVAIDAAGRAIAVWGQLDGAGSATESLWTSRYVPGSGWSAPQLLENNPGTVAGAYLGIDKGSGRAVIAWRQLTTTSYDLWARSFDPASGWGAATAIESREGAVGDASVAVGSDGNATLVWSQVGPSTRFSIFASRYVFGGNWSSPALVESNETLATQDVAPRVTTTPSGSALVTWLRASGSSASLWTNTASASGVWSGEVELVPDAGSLQSIGSHAMAADAAGHALLAWGQVDGSDNAVWYRRYATSSWQGQAARVATGTPTRSTISTPVLSMNTQGAALVAWAIEDGTLFSASAAPLQPFGKRVALRGSAASVPNSLATVGIDDQMNGMAAWSETNGNLYLATLSAGVWSAPAIIENQPDKADMPNLAMNDASDAVLVWRQYVAGAGTKVYAKNYRAGR